MMKRVESSGTDSELFMELLYAGEFILKMTVAALTAAMEEDRERHRYRVIHGLIRADGIGEWSKRLEEILIGPSSQYLAKELTDIRRAFTERLGMNTWQNTAVQNLQEVLEGIYPDAQKIGNRVSLRTWFTKFSELRNKTRGHGAVTPARCAILVPKFRSSIQMLVEHNPFFGRSWAYLHRNLSGKYKVVDLGFASPVFDKLKSPESISGENFVDGIYIWIDGPRRVELLYSDLDTSDFFFPNGGFTGTTYELHSLITDSRLRGDAGPYLQIASDRPPSETEGSNELDIIGDSFTNLPGIPAGYVKRPRLEDEVFDAIMDDRHPIVTLVGRGGIGKTSLALTVLHKIAMSERFQVIIWFSSRDIDLTLAGPRVVRPGVLAESDIADSYKYLINAFGAADEKDVPAMSLMAAHMYKCPLGAILFVFDNFETVRNPIDVYNWIDTNIRLPNKVVITSRFRDFRADLPIEVFGMEYEEANALITQTSISLGIGGEVSTSQREQIIEESNGHPYVIKIILGEIADVGSFGKPSKMLVRKDEILDALFDRTFANLSPMASRIFLTLSGWRSLVPQLAVEAVIQWHESEGGDPEQAIDELVRMSLVERTIAQDDTSFLGVPLAAALFGSRKLEVSPYSQLIDGDIRFLQDLGATTPTGLKQGIRPRMVAFFRKMARRIGNDKVELEKVIPVLEFVARGYTTAWLLLADLIAEADIESGLEKSADYVRRFLEGKPPAEEALVAWQRLLALYRATNNIVGGCSAFLKVAEISDPPLELISSMAYSLNNEREVIDGMDVAERAAIFKPLARLMEGHLADASGTDLSRLAWLHLHVGDERRALEVADLGLERDPENVHCRRLVAKLTS